MSTEVVTKASNGTGTNAVSHASKRYGAVKILAPVAPTASSYAAFFYTPMPAQLWEKTPVSAKITVTMDTGSGSRTLSLIRHGAPNPPAYTEMTHDNKPPNLAGASAHPITQSATSGTWEFDVLADIVSIAAGGAFYGWKLTSTYTALWNLHSWQSKYPPTLTVVFADDPEEPDGLRPDGVVGIAKPTLTWTPIDGLVSARAQIDTVGDDFSSPTFDTGNVPTTEGQLNMSRLDFPGGTWGGITNGASVIARVLQTTDGGNSVWSDPITMTRVNYGPLVITSPGSTTTDPTPTVAWTFTNQERYQVYVVTAFADEPEYGEAHDTDVIVGTANSYTLPVGAVHDGDVLTIVVRAWDTTDRTVSPGDPGYVQSTKLVTYHPGTAAAVSSLNATQDGDRPWVDLEWTRTAGVPDEWLIVRNGSIIDRIDAGTGPVFEYRDWRCPPNQEALYQVTAVEAGAAGDGGPIVPVQPVVTGAWVIDPDTGKHFSCSGDSLPTQTESSVMYSPVGSTVSVKRTFAMRGLEGQVAGSIEDEYDDRTALEQEQDLFAIKSEPSKTYRFVAGDLNIPVLVSNLTSVLSVEQSQTDRIVKDVSFDIAQNGELPFAGVNL